VAEWLSKDYGESLSSGPPSPNINGVDRPPQRLYGPAGSSTSAFAGGSLEYAAPEILRLSRELSHQADVSPKETAERSIVSPAVDIWALGVCIYSLVVGSRPFQNTFQPRVVMAILAGDYDVERLALKGGDEVVECVRGCLEMEDRDRWDVNRVLDSSWLEGLGSDSDDESSWKL
jgi:serine/threonine protein kinase